MAHTIRAIADALGAEAQGDLDLVITGASEPHSAGPTELALVTDPRYAEGLARGSARAALVWAGADWRGMGLEAVIFSPPRARLAMPGLTRMLDPGPAIAPGIHAFAVVDPSAEIGEDAAIGPFVMIGAGAQIGPRARIVSHVSIAEGARIGADALIMPGTRIGPKVTIGDRFIAQPGVVIGADGFSYVTDEKSGVERVREGLGAGETLAARNPDAGQAWTRIHTLGGVTLGDDVEVGANSCIDRGTIRNTVVGSGCKIDNLVQVGHNVRIGRDCMLCSLVGIAGSSQLGDRVVLGGQVGVNDNIFIGDDVIAGGASKIFTNVPAGRVLLGYPAVKMETHIDMQKALRRLPKLAARVAELEKRVPKPPLAD